MVAIPPPHCVTFTVRRSDQPGDTLQVQRKRLPARSAKRASEMQERYRLYDDVARSQGPICGWPGCTRRWDDLHEIHTRARGGSHIDPRILLGLCRAHNSEATDTRPAECAGVVVPGWAGSKDIEWAMNEARRVRESRTTPNPVPCPWRQFDGGCKSTCDAQRSACDTEHGRP